MSLRRSAAFSQMRAISLADGFRRRRTFANLLRNAADLPAAFHYGANVDKITGVSRASGCIVKAKNTFVPGLLRTLLLGQ